MKLKIALILFCAACLLTAGVLLFFELDARKVPALLAEPDDAPARTEDVLWGETFLPSAPSASESAAPRASAESKPAPSAAPLAADFAAITIRSKTYAVKRGVDEATLKKNIGWMESSALPGADGVCVLMGHRNAQLRILKDLRKGEKITLTLASGEVVTYIVRSARVIRGDEPLVFPETDTPTLVLLTCYPFYYVGHAPDTYCVLGELEWGE